MTIATTEALVQRELGGPMTLETITIPEMRPEEALIEMHATGICHTDVAQLSGKIPMGQRPFVLGHEGSGVVLDFGSEVKGLAKGDRVLLSYWHCEECVQCKSGHPSYCESFLPQNFICERRDGSAVFRGGADGTEKIYGSYFGQSSFAKISVVHRSSIVRVDAATPLDKFAPLGCGLMTGAGTVMHTLNVQKGDSVLIMGCGGVGLAGVMAAKIRGAGTIIGVDIVPSRLEIARELGCTHVINGTDADIPEQIIKICPPKGVQFAMDTSGVPDVINAMVRSLGMRGKSATVGSANPGSQASIEIMYHLIMGREYVGATEGDSIAREFVPYLIQQHDAGNFPIDKIIKYYDVRDFQQAIDDMHAGTTLKPVLRWR